jgi:hypothetical protein
MGVNGSTPNTRADVVVCGFIQRALVNVRQKPIENGISDSVLIRASLGDRTIMEWSHEGWKLLERVVDVVKRQSDLLEIILALDAPRRSPSLLYCWQEQRNEYRQDRNHNEKFDQRESLPT